MTIYIEIDAAKELPGADDKEPGYTNQCIAKTNKGNFLLGRFGLHFKRFHSNNDNPQDRFIETWLKPISLHSLLTSFAEYSYHKSVSKETVEAFVEKINNGEIKL